MDILQETFEVHETLNQKIFEGNHLRRDVYNTIIKTVNTFENFIKFPISIADIQICGSNCSYNYTDNSDLDVHIIANFDNVSEDTELLQALYNAKKSSFNKSFDIRVRDIRIELYVQDIRSTVVSNGIYSVCDDCWVKEPKPIKSITKHNTEKELEKWTFAINQAVMSQNIDQINSLLNNLYLVRHNSIAVDGEYGKGNQIFKDVRNAGLLDKLKEARNLTISKELSLESMPRGQIVNRMDK